MNNKYKNEKTKNSNDENKKKKKDVNKKKDAFVNISIKGMNRDSFNIKSVGKEPKRKKVYISKDKEKKENLKEINIVNETQFYNDEYLEEIKQIIKIYKNNYNFIESHADIQGAMIIDEDAYGIRLFIVNTETLEVFDNMIKFRCQYESTDTEVNMNLYKNHICILQKCDEIQTIIYKAKYNDNSQLYEGYWDYCYTKEEFNSLMNDDEDILEDINRKCIFSIYNDFLLNLRSKI